MFKEVEIIPYKSLKEIDSPVLYGVPAPYYDPDTMLPLYSTVSPSTMPDFQIATYKSQPITFNYSEVWSKNG